MAASIRSTSVFNPTGNTAVNATPGPLAPLPAGLAVGDILVVFAFFGQAAAGVNVVTPDGFTSQSPNSSGSSRTIGLFTRVIDSAALSALQADGGVRIRAGATSSRLAVVLAAVQGASGVAAVGTLQYTNSAVTDITFSQPGSGDLRMHFTGNNTSATSSHPVHTSTGGGTKVVQGTTLSDTNASTADTQASLMTGGTGLNFAPGTTNAMWVSLGMTNATAANAVPTAAFTTTKNGLTVTADASTSSDLEGPIANYAWEWGDGATATGVTPQAHVYAADGTYNIKLTVTDNSGATATITKAVTVNAPVSATRPYVVGSLTSTTGAGSSVSIPTPPGAQFGDFLVAFIRGQASNSTADWASAGWSRVTAPWDSTEASSGRQLGIYVKAIRTDPGVEALPASYMFSQPVAGRYIAFMALVRNIAYDNPVVSYSTPYRGVTSTGTIFGSEPHNGEADGLEFVFWGNELTANGSADLTTEPAAAFTKVAQAVTSTDTTISRTHAGIYSYLSNGGQTPTFRITPSQRNGPAAQSVVFRSGSPGTPPPAVAGYAGVYRDDLGANHAGKLFYWDGAEQHPVNNPKVKWRTRTVSRWLDPNNAPWYMAHRGGSYNYPEESDYAYRSAADWGMPCLEISCVQASDGGWINSHDTTLDRLTGVSGWAINAHTVAESKALTILASTVPLNKNQPDQPVTELTEIVNKYYKTHVLMIEVKQGNLTTMLNLLDTYGTTQRPANEIFVIKYDINNQTANTTARNRGYKTWGYIFDSGMSTMQARIDAANPKMTMIGMDYASSDSTLLTGIAQCNAAGIMPTFHIINSVAQRDRGIALGMKGIQVSNILAVAPPWVTRLTEVGGL